MFKQRESLLSSHYILMTGQQLYVIHSKAFNTLSDKIMIKQVHSSIHLCNYEAKNLQLKITAVLVVETSC